MVANVTHIAGLREILLRLRLRLLGGTVDHTFEVLRHDWRDALGRDRLPDHEPLALLGRLLVEVLPLPMREEVEGPVLGHERGARRALPDVEPHLVAELPAPAATPAD